MMVGRGGWCKVVGLGRSHLSFHDNLLPFELNPLITPACRRFQAWSIDDVHHAVSIANETFLRELIQNRMGACLRHGEHVRNHFRRQQKRHGPCTILFLQNPARKALRNRMHFIASSRGMDIMMNDMTHPRLRLRHHPKCRGVYFQHMAGCLAHGLRERFIIIEKHTDADHTFVTDGGHFCFLAIPHHIHHRDNGRRRKINISDDVPGVEENVAKRKLKLDQMWRDELDLIGGKRGQQLIRPIHGIKTPLTDAFLYPWSLTDRCRLAGYFMVSAGCQSLEGGR